MSMALTFADLKKVAKLRHDRLSVRQQARVSRFFEDLDANGDGMIKLKELRNSDAMPELEDEFIRNLFYGLDEDNKGYLDYDDCIALYYLCLHCSRSCRSCGQNIPHGLGYTCYSCFTSPSHKPFVVCLDCFAENRFTHHDHSSGDMLHDFDFHDQLCRNAAAPPPEAPTPAPTPTPTPTPSPTPAPAPAPAPAPTTKPPPAAVQAATVQEFANMKQCVVCGDVHKLTASGFMCNVHMAKMRGTEDQFVCEWCFSYFCSRCGKSFRDSSTRAEPGKWLQKCVCVGCHNSGRTTDIYHSTLQRLQDLLKRDKLLSDCRTCEIKCAKGTLFWIINGVNASQLFPQPRPQPQPQPQPRPPERASSVGVGYPVYMQPRADANPVMPMPNPSAPPGPPARSSNGGWGSPQPQPQPQFQPQPQPQPPPQPRPQPQHQPSKSNSNVVENIMEGIKVLNRVVGIVDKVTSGSFSDDSVAGGGGGGGGEDPFSLGAGDNSSFDQSQVM